MTEIFLEHADQKSKRGYEDLEPGEYKTDANGRVTRIDDPLEAASNRLRAAMRKLIDE